MAASLLSLAEEQGLTANRGIGAWFKMRPDLRADVNTLLERGVAKAAIHSLLKQHFSFPFGVSGFRLHLQEGDGRLF